MDVIIKIAADGLLLLIIAAGGVAILRGVRREQVWIDYSYAIMAGLTSLLIGKLLSLLYQPTIARPFMELGVNPGALYIDNPGFPSDHALLGGVIVLAVYVLTPYKKLAYFLTFALLVMGWARVAALVHTPLDVVGGIAAALAGGIWYLARKHNHSI